MTAKRRALVVGAGKVGEGKITGLVNAGAAVKVVSLTATPQVRRWADEGTIELTESVEDRERREEEEARERERREREGEG